MKRIGILTAGGDTPALNATIYGAVTRANQRRVEVVGFIKGFSGLFNPARPARPPQPALHAPSRNSTRRCGGTIIGASRDYVDADDAATVAAVIDRLHRLQVEGLICVGGDGTLNGMQALADSLPDRAGPQDDRQRPGAELPRASRTSGSASRSAGRPGYRYTRRPPARRSSTWTRWSTTSRPGYATAVFVSATGVQRIRTTAESHRRIAIIEVMGRHSGYLALGTAYGQPDILLVPEHPLDPDAPGRARPGDLRPAEERRHRLRRGRRRRARARNSGPSWRPPTRPATRSSPGRPRPCEPAHRAPRGQLLHQQAAQRVGRGGDLHP